MISGMIVVILFSATCYAIGRLIQKIIKKPQLGAAHAFAAGTYAVLFLAYLFQILTVVSGRSFSFLRTGLIVSCAALCLAGIAVVRGGLTEGISVVRSGLAEGIAGIRAAHGGLAESQRKRILFPAAILVLFLLCVVSIELYEPYFGNDMTVETTAVTLSTGTVYKVNPATGAEFEYGMRMLAKCNAMPQFYAVLCSLSGMSAYSFLCRIVPVWGLFLNVCACSVLAGVIGLKGEKRQNFLIFYLLLLLMGDYHQQTYAFRLLHQGFSIYAVFFATGGMVLLSLLIAGAGRIASLVRGGGRHE